MSDEHNRRATDQLLIEMHGMVQRIDQKMDDTYRDLKDHMRKDEEAFEAHNDRLKPVEELNTFFRVGWKIAAVIFALGGIGGVTAWVRTVASSVPR